MKEDAIRKVVDEAEKFQAETEPFLALHRDDVVLVNLAGRRVLGRDDLEQAMTAALASPLAKVLTRTEIVDIRFPTDDTAIVSCIKYVDDGRASADNELPTRGALTYVLVRHGETWRIALAQTTPIAA